jgi:protein gp37
MGENTAISWTDHTWNPWVGCRKVSAGCRNCYMFRDQERYGSDPKVVRRTAPATFDAPLRWKEPGLVFTCSWSDFFIEEADEWRQAAWDIMVQTPCLTYQVLTKRVERIERAWHGRIQNWPTNIWLGVTAENQDELDSRWPVLEHIGRMFNVSVLFLSIEPMLGIVDIANALYWQETPTKFGRGVDWVIVGGESGSGARPMELDWVRNVREQCRDNEIPFFFKQVGGTKKVNGSWGGDLLDGKQYHEFPERR